MTCSYDLHSVRVRVMVMVMVEFNESMYHFFQQIRKKKSFLTKSERMVAKS